jgi:hypothetical protein
MEKQGDSEELILPEYFTPSHKEVVVGRGKKVAAHPGNKRFRELVKAELKEYSEANTKAHKSSIILRVLKEIRDNSEYAFVKQDLSTGRWYKVEETSQRITTAQAFRDAMGDNYKSSRRHKKQKREEEKKKPAFESKLRIKKRKTKRGRTESAKATNQQVLLGLRGILDEATEALMAGDFDSCLGEDKPTSLAVPSKITFPNSTKDDLNTSGEDSDLAGLLAKYARDVEATENPFEPRPIALQEEWATASIAAIGIDDSPLSITLTRSFFEDNTNLPRAPSRLDTDEDINNLSFCSLKFNNEDESGDFPPVGIEIPGILNMRVAMSA